MMKMHYKKIGATIALIGGAIIITPALAADDPKTGPADRAQMAQDRKEVQMETRTQNVCEKIAQFADNLNQKTSEKENGVKTQQQARFTNWENKTNEADYKLESLRTDWENNREEQFTKLEEAAKTDDQKTAVETFEAEVKSAIATRQKAVDSAVETFRMGVKNAIQLRQDQVDSIVSSSASSRSVALAKAQSDCEAGKDAATVRASFQNGLKGARTQLQNDRQNVEKVNSTVQASIQTRRAAVEKAMGDFKMTMEKARVALKTAFSDNTTDTETEN